MSAAALKISNEDSRGVEASSNQYLAFILAGEEYGVDILRVQEIKGWTSVTLIPNMPPHIKGVLNLRGTIVPIIDLRLRFGLDSIAYGATTVIVVLKVTGQQGSRTMGIVVDAVSDVYNVTAAEMKAPPDFGGSIKTEYVNGLATLDKKMVILLNIDRLLNGDEVAVLENISADDR